MDGRFWAALTATLLLAGTAVGVGADPAAAAPSTTITVSGTSGQRAPGR